jgi:AraC-like DNA-binding protein
MYVTEFGPYWRDQGATLCCPRSQARDFITIDDKTRPFGGLAGWQHKKLAEFIEEHLDEEISVHHLAEIAQLSRYHFGRAFKRSFGLPPHRYHMNRRIERAKSLLRERARSVTEVGLMLGFCDTSAFTTSFRRAIGMTPSDYRRALPELGIVRVVGI